MANSKQVVVAQLIIWTIHKRLHDASEQQQGCVVGIEGIMVKSKPAAATTTNEKPKPKKKRASKKKAACLKKQKRLSTSDASIYDQCMIEEIDELIDVRKRK